MKLPLKRNRRSGNCAFLTLGYFSFSSAKAKVKHFVESKNTSKEKGEQKKKKKRQSLCIKHFRVLIEHIREQKELSGSYLAVVAIVNVVLFHY